MQRTREQAIENLKDAWHTQNNCKKALWDAQTQADQNRQEGLNAQNQAAEEQNQANTEADNIDKMPKLGSFAATTSISDEISLKPSTYAINKLRDKKYIELYCFTPASCCDHINQKLSTADEAFSFSYGISPYNSTGGTLTLKPVLALSHPGKIIPDTDLTWEQIRDTKACFLSHIIEAKWNQSHIDALMLFFLNLDGHPYSDTTEGKQALVWYQAHACED